MKKFKRSGLLEDLASSKHLRCQAYSSTSKKVSIHFNKNTCGRDIINFGRIDHCKAKTMLEENAKTNIQTNSSINPPSRNA
jgi:hypothetical protein